jgi:hypothetical protein
MTETGIVVVLYVSCDALFFFSGARKEPQAATAAMRWVMSLARELSVASCIHEKQQENE